MHNFHHMIIDFPSLSLHIKGMKMSAIKLLEWLFDICIPLALRSFMGMFLFLSSSTK